MIDNGRPFKAPNGFTVKVVASATQDAHNLTGEDERAMWLHRDASMVPGFPRKLSGSANTGDGASSPVLVDLDGDNRNELVVGGSDGIIHAFRPERLGAAGLAGAHAIRCRSTPASGRSTAARSPPTPAGRFSRRSPRTTSTTTASRRSSPPTCRGRSTAGGRTATSSSIEQSNPDYSGKPLAPFVNSRHGKFNRTQHGFIGSPVLADLDGDGTQEVIAASMDRHVYAWHMNGDPVAGFPVLVVDPSKVSVDRPGHPPGHLQRRRRLRAAGGDRRHSGGRRSRRGHERCGRQPEIVVGTNEEYDGELRRWDKR